MFLPALGPALAFLLLLFPLVHAQAPPPAKIFQWEFSNQFISTTLTTCRSFPITVFPFNSTDANKTLVGVPPFYMLSFEIGGIPQTQLIGENQTTLNWQVTHKPGAQLWLDVVDSIGSSGGIGPETYTVAAGQDTSCVPTDEPTDFTFTSNFTMDSQIETCVPWGLRIQGGVPPYNITIMETSSAIVTNVSTSGNEDAMTYINRGDPNRQLLAAVADQTGRWALGTPVVNTFGTADTTCVGLDSSTGFTSQLNQQQAALNASIAAAKKKRTATIAGVTVTLVVLLIGGGVAGYFFYRRRRQGLEEETQIESGPEQTQQPPSDMFESRPGQVLSINSFIDAAPATMTESSGSRSPGSSSMISGISSSNPFSSPHDRDNRSTRTLSDASSGRNGFARFPSQSVRRSAKEIEAGIGTAYSSEHSMPSSRMLIRNASAAPSTVSNASVLRVGNPDPESPGAEYVYQHADGGTVLRELPPPYVDRGNNNNNGNSSATSPAESPIEEVAEAEIEEEAAAAAAAEET